VRGQRLLLKVWVVVEGVALGENWREGGGDYQGGEHKGAPRRGKVVAHRKFYYM